MTQVTFYLLPELAEAENNQDNIEPQPLVVACQFIASCYTQGKKVQVLTDDQQQAELLDELLFQQPTFIPHNLMGEGPHFGTAVEISWKGSSKRKPILVNLKQQVAENANQYQHIIDFVPTDETRKQAARERYKSYRNLGFHLYTEKLPANHE